MIVHVIHFPVSARSFVAPVVRHLRAAGVPAELWVQDHPRHRDAIAAIAREMGAAPVLIDCDLTVNPWRFWRRLRALRARIRLTRPAAIHAHQTRASVLPLLAARLEGVPVRIYHNHGLPYLGHRGLVRWLLRALERVNARAATQVLLVSRSNLDEAERDGLFAARPHAILAQGSAAGIDLDVYRRERFAPTAALAARRELGLPETGFVVSFVGRPVARKGFHLLLRAWKDSGLAGAGGVLVAAGCAPEECARALGEPVAGVRGLGYLPDLVDFYAACDVVALPSDHEGFPYALLEGAAAGRALIGSDVPGVRSAIDHERTGLLVPPQDQPALAAALRRLADDPALRLALGSAARDRVERMYDRRQVLDAFLDHYRGLGLVPAAAQAVR